MKVPKMQEKRERTKQDYDKVKDTIGYKQRKAREHLVRQAKKAGKQINWNFGNGQK